MGCLGVLFALDEGDVRKLKAVPREERNEYLYEEIEETFFEEFPERTQELDKSWDAMHRMLTDGKLDFENGFPPLCNVIFGGEQLYGIVMEGGEYIIPDDEDDGFIILKTPEQVKEIAEALPKKKKEDCRQCYDSIDEEDYGQPLSDEDFEYTWEWFQTSIQFWLRAAEEKRYVIFSVDR